MSRSRAFQYSKKSIIKCDGYKFQKLEKLGDGTYGTVYKAKDLRSKQIVAIKKIKPEDGEEGISSTTIREIALLKELSHHKNIVTLHDVTVCDQNNMYLIFEFAQYDLKKYINQHKRNKKCLSAKQLKNILYQLLEGIAYCHANRIMHRDLKPQNILISGEECVKIADFGLARTFSIPNRDWTHEVVTLWYRAPEILLGDDQYTPYVDIWGLGAIFSEMVNDSKPLFRGDSEITQLMAIFRICGSPNQENWPSVTALKYYKANFPQWKAKSMQDVVPRLDRLGRDFLSRMLMLNPIKRVTAKQALNHPYFSEVDII